MQYHIEPYAPSQDMDWFITRQFESTRENNALPPADSPEEQAAVHRQELLEFLGSQAHAQILICKQGDGLPLGYIWIAERGFCDPWDFREAPAWIYDLWVDPAYRKRGLGKALLLAACQWARDAGFHRMGLHVFGGNRVAIHLYQATGFYTAHTYLQKELNSQPAKHPAGDAIYRVERFTPGQDPGELTTLWYENFKAISQAYGAPADDPLLDQFKQLSAKVDFNSHKQATFTTYDPKDRLAGFVRVYRSKGDLGDQTYTWMWAPEISSRTSGQPALEALLRQVDAWSWEQNLNVIRTGPYPDSNLCSEVQSRGYTATNLFMFKNLEN
jgi:ribosomal protein S18 acetylase RimI-like enzyme